MAQIADLFKNQKEDLYGKVGNIIIGSQGLINPPRGAALLTASPTSNGALVGNLVGTLVKGSANRPTDTIFKKFSTIAKPITLTNDTNIGLKLLVQKGEKYYVKTDIAGASKKLQPWNIGPLPPIPDPFLSKEGNEKRNKLYELIYGKPPKKDPNDKKVRVPTDSDFEYNKPAKFIDIHQKDRGNDVTNYTSWVRKQGDGKLKKRDAPEDKIYSNETSVFDIVNKEVLSKLYYEDDTKLKNELLSKNIDVEQTVVVIKPYGKDYSFVLPGTITGISEDLSPDWVDFKYLGSPFKKYKYNGVERSLKFELKMYYTNQNEKVAMIAKINSLKELTFPYDEIIAIKYAGLEDYSQLTYTGNFIELSIGGMYNKVFGFIDSLGISVEDNVAWPSGNPYGGTDKNDKPYPSVVNISFSMKIIENHKIESKTNVQRFKYDFDGNEANTISTTHSNKKT